MRKRFGSILRKSLWSIHEWKTTHMLSILLLAIFFLYPLHILAIEPLQDNMPLSPKELKKRIQVVIPEKAGYSSLVIDSSFFPNPKAVLNIRLFFKRPDEYALYMLDGFDSTPVFVVTQEHSLLYDPLKDHILHIRNKGLIFKVGYNLEEDQFILEGAFRHLTVESKPFLKNTVIVDLPSILNQMTIDLKAEKIARNEFLLSGFTKNQGYVTAHINTTATIPLTRMMIYAKAQRTPFFAFNKIETETTINDGIFEFPLIRLHNSGLSVKEMEIHEIENANILQEAKVIFMAIEGIFTRSAIRHPELRRETSQRIQDDDWLSI